MEDLTKSMFMPFNLQFFAEDGSDDSEATGDSTDTGEDNQEEGNKDDQSQNKSGTEKTFTQADINKMMKAEKESGKRAILKELGLTDVKTAKEGLKSYQVYLDSQKTDTEKKDEAITTLSSEKSQAEQKAYLLECKFTAITEGVKLDSVDDVIALAVSKVTDDKDLKTVLTEMKEKYPSFFTEDSQEGSSKGTGTGVSSGSKKGATSGIGSRLASANKSTKTGKSAYFS